MRMAKRSVKDTIDSTGPMTRTSSAHRQMANAMTADKMNSETRNPMR